ncbi:hypothetical protein B0H21DRAFT_895182 [Amylocystis lapponica]|nr:hypothetical protein B0H21DRAFT_895182 [Amylocystis lapponica]
MSTSQNASPYSDLDKVPDDILLEIFHHLLSPSDTAIQESDTWIPVQLSHVCSNWRSLTLASPLLWTSISFTTFSDPAILRQYLTRSGDTLLRIDIAAPPMESTLDVLAPILSNQSHRFVSFHLYNVDGETAMEVLSFFTSPAPQLRSLHIRPFLETSLDPVFDDQMPLLRDMEITADPINLLARENLTRLVIRYIFVEADQLVNLLRACPNLVSLDLACLVQPVNVLHRLKGTPVIPLKCLRELHVESSDSSDTFILPYLSFPKATIVKLDLLTHSELVTALRDCVSLHEIASDAKTATLELSQTAYYIYVTLRSPQLDIQVHGYHAALEGCEFTGFSAMPFQTLSHLTIRDNGCPFPEHQWRHSFQRIPTITHLEVCAKDVTTLAILRAIGTDIPDAETVLCPELTHLVLSGDVDEGQAVCEEMLSCCLARAAAGAPIMSCEIVLKTREEIPTSVLARLDEIGVQIINPSNTAEVTVTPGLPS